MLLLGFGRWWCGVLVNWPVASDCGVAGVCCFDMVLLIGPVTGFTGLCCGDGVETSYEGHMVDALASRADEGRRSLR